MPCHFVKIFASASPGRTFLLQGGIAGAACFSQSAPQTSLVAGSGKNLCVRTACLAAVRRARRRASTVAAIRAFLDNLGSLQEIEAAWPGYRGAMMERHSKRLQEPAGSDSVFDREVAQRGPRRHREENSRLHGICSAARNCSKRTARRPELDSWTELCGNPNHRSSAPKTALRRPSSP